MSTLTAGDSPQGLVQQERMFFALASVAMIAVIAIGFAPSFYLRGVIAAPHPYEPLIPLVFAHGLLFSAFLLLFAAQTWLAAAGRVDLHMKLGLSAFVILPIMVIVAIFVSLGGVFRPITAPPGLSPLSWLAVPLIDIPVFATLFGLGLANRARPEIHKRFMFLGMTDMMQPGFGRWPLPFSPLTTAFVGTVVLPALFILALLVWDLRSRGRPSNVTVIGGALIVAIAAVKPLIWATPWWLGFAKWASMLVHPAAI